MWNKIIIMLAEFYTKLTFLSQLRNQALEIDKESL